MDVAVDVAVNVCVDVVRVDVGVDVVRVAVCDWVVQLPELAFILYYLLKNPKRIKNSNPHITLNKEEYCSFFGVLKRLVV